jgi:hypothetical protein
MLKKGNLADKCTKCYHLIKAKSCNLALLIILIPLSLQASSIK